MRVLAGDVGGTKVLLSLATVEDGRVEAATPWRADSAAHTGLLPIVQEFLHSHGVAAGTIDAACFGIAGPVRCTVGHETAKVTNLPWTIDSTALARATGIPHVRLINDFQAFAYGIEALPATDLVILQAGEPQPRQPRAVLGAGTGLGQGLLIWQHDHYEAVATEGGHVDFAPTNPLQVDLWRYLTAKFGRASYERVLSGPGLINVYLFLCERQGTPPTSAFQPASTDAAATISEAALGGSDPLAVEALRLFVQVYGAQAGNCALACLATGGVYLGGGIAPKILPALQNGDFMQCFNDKGRMRDLLRTIAVSLVRNEKAGLLGAALAAARLVR